MWYICTAFCLCVFLCKGLHDFLSDEFNPSWSPLYYKKWGKALFLWQPKWAEINQGFLFAFLRSVSTKWEKFQNVYEDLKQFQVCYWFSPGMSSDAGTISSWAESSWGQPLLQQQLKLMGREGRRIIPVSSTSVQLERHQKEPRAESCSLGDSELAAPWGCVARLENCFHFSAWEGNEGGKQLLLRAVTV